MTSQRLQIGLFESLEEMLFPTETKVAVDPNKELATYNFALNQEDDDVSVARSSLEYFLNQWAFQLATDSSPSPSSRGGSNRKNGLSTPISAGQFQEVNNLNASSNTTSTSSSTSSGRLRIMFRPPPRYLSYNEQKNMEKGTLPDRKGAKLDSKSPGGVDIVVTYSLHEIQLIVKRCCYDSDTILKEASERAIVRRLDEAMRIWQKVRAMKI